MLYNVKHAEGYCEYSGSFQVFFESVSYINLVLYLRILRKTVTNATENRTQLVQIYSALICVLSSLIWVIIFYGPEIGVESTCTCGVEYDKTFT